MSPAMSRTFAPLPAGDLDQQPECAVGVAAVLEHEHALGLLDDRPVLHCLQQRGALDGGLRGVCCGGPGGWRHRWAPVVRGSLDLAIRPAGLGEGAHALADDGQQCLDLPDLRLDRGDGVVVLDRGDGPGVRSPGGLRSGGLPAAGPASATGATGSRVTSRRAGRGRARRTAPAVGVASRMVMPAASSRVPPHS